MVSNILSGGALIYQTLKKMIEGIFGQLKQNIGFKGFFLRRLRE